MRRVLAMNDRAEKARVIKQDPSDLLIAILWHEGSLCIRIQSNKSSSHRLPKGTTATRTKLYKLYYTILRSLELAK